MATKEYFPGIGKIKFEGKESKNPMAVSYTHLDVYKRQVFIYFPFAYGSVS